MAWFPKLSTEWLNGWILLVVYSLAFGTVVLRFPQEVITRLYDKSCWTREQRALATVGKALSGVLLLLLTFSPLRIRHIPFPVGVGLYSPGIIGLVIAPMDYRSAPPGQPATQSLYRVWRNPQWMMLVLVFLGGCLAIGSLAALFLFVAAAICYDFRNLTEERSCLALYAEGYRDYMARVPRYLLAF